MVGGLGGRAAPFPLIPGKIKRTGLPGGAQASGRRQAPGRGFSGRPHLPAQKVRVRGETRRGDHTGGVNNVNTGALSLGHFLMDKCLKYQRMPPNYS